MKLLILAACLTACTAGRLDNSYLPPNQGGGGSGGYSGGASANYQGGGGSGSYQGGAGGFGHGGNAFGGAGQQQGGFGGQYNQQSTRQQASYDAGAQITRYNADVKPDSFSYDFETSNGIRAEASGVATNGVQEHGSFSYKGDDGQDYSITYTADENGYRPQGAHLPTPPPIPQEILESLQKNARDEANGISDDGSYHGEGASGPSSQYGAPSGQYNAPSGGYNAPSGQYNAPSNQYNAPSNQYNAPSNHYNAPSGHGSAPSAQYNAPSQGPSRNYLAPVVQAAKTSGNGNFNPSSGYKY